MEPLTPTHVQTALEVAGLDIRVETFDSSTATAEQAAASIGTALGSIVKSLVFVIDREQPIVVLAAGDQKVDTRKIAAIFDVGRKKVKIASTEQCLEYVGYAPGGVPPLGHRQPVPVYIDATLARFEIIYAAAGSPHTIFPIPYQTLVEVTGAEVKDLVVG